MSSIPTYFPTQSIGESIGNAFHKVKVTVSSWANRTVEFFKHVPEHMQNDPKVAGGVFAVAGLVAFGAGHLITNGLNKAFNEPKLVSKDTTTSATKVDASKTDSTAEASTEKTKEEKVTTKTPLKTFVFSVLGVGIPVLGVTYAVARLTNYNLPPYILAAITVGAIAVDLLYRVIKGRNDPKVPEDAAAPATTDGTTGTGTPPATGTGTPPATGTGTPPATGTGTLPATGTGTPPATGTGTPPATGTGTPPKTGTGTPPTTETGTPPATGTGTPPATGTVTLPATGTGTLPATGTGTPPATGTVTPPATGTVTPPATGTVTPPTQQGEIPTPPPVPGQNTPAGKASNSLAQKAAEDLKAEQAKTELDAKLHAQNVKINNAAQGGTGQVLEATTPPQPPTPPNVK